MPSEILRITKVHIAAAANKPALAMAGRRTPYPGTASIWPLFNRKRICT